MKKILMLSILLIIGTAQAETEFCRGFEEGYKIIKGDNVYVPFCPFEPFTPFGSTPFREGIKAGMEAAKR